MNLTYRKAVLEDCRAVYELICEMECKPLSIEKFFGIYQEQIGSKSYYCLVCECEDMVIGVINLRFEKQLHHSECIAEIMEFVIESSYRNRGIGKEMLGKACQLVKEAGCVQIEVACNQLRTETHRFYQREEMQNFHFKFSKSLISTDTTENMLGR